MGSTVSGTCWIRLRDGSQVAVPAVYVDGGKIELLVPQHFIPYDPAELERARETAAV